MTVTVIGFGMSPADLTARQLDLIHQAEVLVGGKRHLAAFSDLGAEALTVEGKLSDIVDFIRERMADRRVVVLASGDPLFYGIGAYLVRTLGPEKVEVLPNVNAVSAAFAKIKEGWHDAAVVSLHGRAGYDALTDALKSHDKIAVMTDPRHTPAWIGGFLRENRFDHFKISVLERLGSDDERVSWHGADEIVRLEFAEPNIVILRRTEDISQAVERLRLGMPDDAFVHQGGLITKSEVRVVTIAKLCLDRPDLVLWDLGAGSGSISLEASLFIPRGRIVAVEQHATRVEQIHQNQKRFGVSNMDVVHATLPDGINGLPEPDRIFIGGGGQRLGKIIRAAGARLAPDGVMVVNTVLIENIGIAMETMKSEQFMTEITQIQTSNGKTMPWGERLQAQNPVWIIAGYRGKEER